MNEEVNFCDQCGSKINSDAKFCSSCGHDLKNSSTKITSDKTIKVELTNVTIEKGFKAIGKGVKAPGKGLKKVFKTKERYPSQTYEGDDITTPPGMTITEIIKSLITVVGVVAFIVLLGVLVEWFLNT